MHSDKIILAFTDHKDWRSWLDKNSSVSSEAWIMVQKKNSTSPGIFLDEAVEEALCFGWIDSTLNTRDDQSYLLRFSPRKPTSVWSINNIRRVEMLLEKGLMKDAGLAAVQAAKESGQWQGAIDRENPDYIPPELKAVLNQEASLWKAYQELPVSKRKQYVYWIQSAIKEGTKEKRISEILQLLRDKN
jgi:uncharacterized protein YdeI (YjbR/CyaY-like superfamily)